MVVKEKTLKNLAQTDVVLDCAKLSIVCWKVLGIFDFTKSKTKQITEIV